MLLIINSHMYSHKHHDQNYMQSEGYNFIKNMFSKNIRKIIEFLVFQATELSTHRPIHIFEQRWDLAKEQRRLVFFKLLIGSPGRDLQRIGPLYKRFSPESLSSGPHPVISWMSLPACSFLIAVSSNITSIKSCPLNSA